MCMIKDEPDVPFPFKEQGKRLSNWGRWGADDERGTLNFLTPDVTRAAAASIRSGRCFELSIPLGSDGPQTGLGGRVNPVHLLNMMPSDFTMDDGMCVADDFIMMPLQCATQWDGLCHVGYDGLFYNGVPAATVTAFRGASRNAIDKTLPGVAGRGVLLDIARLHGVDWLPGGHEITADDLDAASRKQGVEIRSGDTLLFRTGWRRKAMVEGWAGWLTVEPGLGATCADWLHDKEIAALASDNWGIEAQPTREGFMPLHCILIRDMGMMLGEIWDLEALAEDCARDGQWDFFLTAPSLRVTGGIGSPVSPVAIK
jgi:kynurenine formamidase